MNYGIPSLLPILPNPFPSAILHSSKMPDFCENLAFYRILWYTEWYKIKTIIKGRREYDQRKPEKRSHYRPR